MEELAGDQVSGEKKGRQREEDKVSVAPTHLGWSATLM
jgi:hypothetical protein